MTAMANTEFIRPSAPYVPRASGETTFESSGHFVQLYERDAYLIETVSDLVADGLAGGDGVVVLATKPHREEIERLLRQRGLDLDSPGKRDQYVALDAAETISRFIVDEWPDKERFEDLIGNTISLASGENSRRQVRAFGEMVALLWADGKRDAAIRLEELWNGLARKLSFSLCCAYPLALLGSDVEGAAFTRICTEHSWVIPAESYTALRTSDERLRFVGRLQQREKVLETQTLERRKAERTLQLCERELTDFLENAAEGLHQVGPDGRILWANQAQLRLLGYSAAEYVGHRLADFYLRPELFDSFWRRIMSGEVVREFAAELRGKDGSARNVVVNSIGFWQDGRFLYTRCFIRDVTDRVELERELRKRVVELAEADQRKNEFLAMLSHELRNPLGAVSTAVHVLSRTDSGPQAERARTIVGRQTQNLTRIVDDLLDVARVTSGRIGLIRQPMNAAECVTECISTLTSAGQLEGREVRTETEPVWIDGDPARLTQIVTNLLLNAVKYTPEGGRIVASARPDGEHALIRVEDNGTGISAEFLPRVFELFAQSESEPDRSRGGLGIGLTLVRRLVELHGGTVEAASEGYGRGSVFTVRIPRLAAPQPKSSAANASAKPVTSRRILIIEDQDDGREALRTMLGVLGHETFESCGGQEAVNLALTLKPDVALIDIGLPGLDGYELARRIRFQRGGRRILLVALTGYGQFEDRSRAYEAGFDVHLVKPLDLEQFSKILSTSEPGMTMANSVSRTVPRLAGSREGEKERADL
jgi:PAS domain S-box-containing protein